MLDPFDDITPDETLFIPEDVELAEWIREQSPYRDEYEEEILQDTMRLYDQRNQRSH
jgi:hypothetical protein